MVQTWQSENRPNETCPECGSVYKVMVTRFPCKDRDCFQCIVCMHPMREWNGTYSYSYEIISQGTKHINQDGGS